MGIRADLATVIDPDAPSIARIYDYVLGGALNFACDRRVAKEVLRLVPGYRDFALANRAFLHRGVRTMLDLGIRQFLDLGSGLPTVSPVHKVAQRIDSTSRVVYVDNDPIAAAHNLLLVGEDCRLGVVEADLRDVESVLDAPDTRRVLDLSRPIGLLMVGVLHFMSDSAGVVRVMAAYHRRLVTDSMLLASHATSGELRPEVVVAAVQQFTNSGIQVTSRTGEEFQALLGPWQVTEDGVVETRRWRAESLADLNRRASLGHALLAVHG